MKFVKGGLMNKGELIESVASQANLSKADAGRAVDAIIDAIVRNS